MKYSNLAALAVVFASSALAACGTITQGTSQDIAVTSTPEGAHCDFTRKGRLLGTIDRTPGTLTVDKTKHDIMLTCALPGYQTASVNLESGYGIGTFGNIILGGLIGWGIDEASGAVNKYPTSAQVTFVPLGTADTAPPAPSPAPAASAAPPAATPVSQTPPPWGMPSS